VQEFLNKKVYSRTEQVMLDVNKKQLSAPQKREHQLRCTFSYDCKLVNFYLTSLLLY